jgi:hypothetical protein
MGLCFTTKKGGPVFLSGTDEEAVAGRNHVEQGGNKPLLDSPECATIGAKHIGARGCAL